MPIDVDWRRKEIIREIEGLIRAEKAGNKELAKKHWNEINFLLNLLWADAFAEGERKQIEKFREFARELRIGH